MDTKVLEHIGLTKNESIVYLTLLRAGTSKTGDILKNSGLNSGKIYEILDSLEKKGLVSESVINNIKHYTAASPSQILEYIDKKKEELKEDESILKKAIPDLERIKEKKLVQVRAVTYMGLRGIKTAADEALDSIKVGDEILGMGVTILKDKKINEFWKSWSLKRVEKRTKFSGIFSERSEYFQDFKKMKHTEVKVLEGITPVTVDIFGEDKVLILNYNEPISCILIHNKNTAISFKQFFNQLWKIAKTK